MNGLKIECPAINKDVDSRKRDLKESIKDWIYSNALVKLIEVFGGNIPKNMEFYEYVSYINDFAEIWDYRKNQNVSGERWTVKDNDMVLKNVDIILHSAEKLGLMGLEEPTVIPDYILPLGGARLTNYTRPQLAKSIIDANSDMNIQVVALTGKRPINEIELEYLADYAPNASTEYDAMCGGIEKVFGLEMEDYVETNFVTSNLNMQWSIRNYDKKYINSNIVVLAAPSTDESRRSNSYDTFKFFLERFNIIEGNKVLLVTSGIYAPFQLLKFMPIALEKNIYVDCVGLNNKRPGSAFNKPANYCQEIKSTINAIKMLTDLYWQ